MFTLFTKYTGCDWEEVDSFDNEKDAMAMLKEYRMAFGTGFVWKVVKS